MSARICAVIGLVALSTAGCGARLSATVRVTTHGRAEAPVLALTCVNGVGVPLKLGGTRLPTLHPELALSTTRVRELEGRRLPNGQMDYRCVS